MDVVMFEAQRQGRLSFYMVCWKYTHSAHLHTDDISPGLRWRGRDCCRVSSRIDSRRRGFRPVPRSRSIPTKGLHIEELHESIIRKLQ